MNNETKQLIYRNVSEKVKNQCGNQTPHACLYWTHHTIKELAKHSIKACWQAGDCFWPRIRQDDIGYYPPDESTHYGYQWDPEANLSQLAVECGHLPEVHIWAGIVTTQEIIDFTTQFFPQCCQDLLRWNWPGDKPPQYYWGHCNDLPDGVHYRPSSKATMAIVQIATQVIRSY